MQQDKPVCTSLVALGLIATGLLFFVSEIFGFNAWSVIWPLFVLVPGLPFLYFAVNSEDKNAAWLAIPGSLIAGTGAILLFQSFTGHWESWAYIWTLYGVFFGLAMRHAGRRTNTKEAFQVGTGFLVASAIGFVVLGTFFELFIFDGFLRRFILAGLLIFLGMRLLAREHDGQPQFTMPDKPKNKAKRSPDDALEQAEFFVRSSKEEIGFDGELAHDRQGKSSVPVILSDEPSSQRPDLETPNGHPAVQL